MLVMKRGKIRLNSKKNFIFTNKKAIVADYLPWILIAVAVLVVLTISILVMKDKGFQLIDKLKSVFSGRV